MTSLEEWLTDPDEPTHASDQLSPYLYRYMGADGLLYTIRDQAIRMNAWSQMNDPREAKEWVSSGTLRAVAPYTDVEMRARLDAVLRRSARLMSLSDDREPIDDPARPHLFHRGWARAALWSHYASRHSGVCLVLDSAALMETVRLEPAVNGRYTTWGRITYADEPIRVALSGDFDGQEALDEALEELLDKRWTISGLHMTKNKDWAYEEEIRLATVDLRADDSQLDTSLTLPLRDALAGVIFGDAHPAARLVADGIRASMGSRAPEMFRCGWVGRAPQLHRIPTGP